MLHVSGARPHLHLAGSVTATQLSTALGKQGLQIAAVDLESMMAVAGVTNLATGKLFASQFIGVFQDVTFMTH
jgi:hypothetical protein